MAILVPKRLRWLLGFSLLAGGAYVGFNLQNSATCACAPAIATAKTYLGAMTRVQQMQYQETGQFTPDWMAMHSILGVPDETDHYRYSLEMIDEVLYGFAIAKDSNRDRNVITALAPPEAEASPENHSPYPFIMCQSEQVGSTAIPLPTYDGETFECASSTIKVN